jgi:hypothetical protein
MPPAVSGAKHEACHRSRASAVSKLRTGRPKASEAARHTVAATIQSNEAAPVGSGRVWPD